MQYDVTTPQDTKSGIFNQGKVIKSVICYFVFRAEF